MKLYDNKDWLFRHYKIMHESIEKIAKECGVSTRTIRNALQRHDIK